MKPLWVVERPANFHPIEYARSVFETGMNCLQEDGYLDSAAFVVTRHEIRCLPVSFEGQDEKEQLYRRIVSYARSNEAEFIVTLNDAYCGEKEDSENYYPGKLREIGADDCIFVT